LLFGDLFNRRKHLTLCAWKSPYWGQKTFPPKITVSMAFTFLSNNMCRACFVMLNTYKSCYYHPFPSLLQCLNPTATWFSHSRQPRQKPTVRLPCPTITTQNGMKRLLFGSPPMWKWVFSILAWRHTHKRLTDCCCSAHRGKNQFS